MKLGYRICKIENENAGTVKYSVKLVPYSKLSEEAVVNLALNDSNINSQDLAAGFAALTQAIYDFVLNGHSITISGLGNFRLTARTGIWDNDSLKWKSAGKTSMDDVSSDEIKGVYVRFRPCTALREQLQGAKYFDVTKTVFGKKWAEPTAAPGDNTAGGGGFNGNPADDTQGGSGNDPSTGSGQGNENQNSGSGSSGSSGSTTTSVATPVISDDANITANGTVHVTCATDGATMYYTVGMDSDPADPTNQSTAVPANGTIVANESYSEDAHLKVIAYKDGVYSSVASKTVPARQDD